VYFKVLGRVVVAYRNGFFVGIRQNDFAIVSPSVASGGLVWLRQHVAVLVDQRHGIFGELARRRDQPCGRVRAVLRLTDEVAGDNFRVCRFIRDDQNLGRASEKINTHAPKQNAFGFGNKTITRPHQYVGFVTGE